MARNKKNKYLVILVSDRYETLHLQYHFAPRRPKKGTEMTILGEDMTVDEPGRVGAVLDRKTRDFVEKHWNTPTIKEINNLLAVSAEAARMPRKK